MFFCSVTRAFIWRCNKWQHEANGTRGHVNNTARCSAGFSTFLFLFLSSFKFVSFLFLHIYILLLFLSFLRVVFYSSFVFLQFYISLLLSIPILISFWRTGRIKHSSARQITQSIHKYWLRCQTLVPYSQPFSLAQKQQAQLLYGPISLQFQQLQLQVVGPQTWMPE